MLFRGRLTFPIICKIRKKKRKTHIQLLFQSTFWFPLWLPGTFLPYRYSLGPLRFPVEAVAAGGPIIQSQRISRAQPPPKASPQRDVTGPLRHAASSHFSLVARQRLSQDSMAVSFPGHSDQDQSPKVLHWEAQIEGSGEWDSLWAVCQQLLPYDNIRFWAHSKISRLLTQRELSGSS